MIEVPITISFKGNQAKLDRELFGTGKEVTDPEIIEFAKEKGLGKMYEINDRTEITDGVTLSVKQVKQRIQESFEPLPLPVEFQYVMFITGTIGLTKLSYEATKWFIDKMEKLHCGIKIDGKEIQNKEEFQKTLDEYVKSKQA